MADSPHLSWAAFVLALATLTPSSAAAQADYAPQANNSQSNNPVETRLSRISHHLQMNAAQWTETPNAVAEGLESYIWLARGFGNVNNRGGWVNNRGGGWGNNVRGGGGFVNTRGPGWVNGGRGTFVNTSGPGWANGTGGGAFANWNPWRNGWGDGGSFWNW
ncbi:GrrA/OscA1 family cyclophane-containing rSAM-modified RiPP [Synechococcus sp. PCC 6312]|uniref:GrrA/OscA1 family cyclophane-containing rSAM-modified RiPP n=1 Tax=Synechococcus sp. (strain ATCC 27167 / PCC 6312) TaxID=195253 RepID=UPI00029F165B|nr:GrrA/OscA1 family cyclophane-containing rSAM-modified RiPP [Synechococcus sp. PCC 6312]AFY61373.1 hypothetical protein Syn6312_2258 [Synechococcus sp. PCC 6312]